MQEEIKDIRTVKITSKGQISIPSTIRARTGFEEGAKVNVICRQYRDPLGRLGSKRLKR